MNDIREIIGNKIPKTATHYQLSKICGRDVVLFFKQEPRKPEPTQMLTHVVPNRRELEMIYQNLRCQNNQNGHFQYGWTVPL